jgi:hypothetical protein
MAPFFGTLDEIMHAAAAAAAGVAARLRCMFLTVRVVHVVRNQV